MADMMDVRAPVVGVNAPCGWPSRTLGLDHQVRKASRGFADRVGQAVEGRCRTGVLAPDQPDRAGEPPSTERFVTTSPAGRASISDRT
jgi:hypothetical protein